MNRLYKILVITFLIVSCKQQINPDTKNDVLSDTEKHINQEQTIQEFLNELKKNIREKDTDEISRKIKMPFEFYTAGEIDYVISNINDLINESSDFNKIADSRFSKEIEGSYYIIYDKEYEETKGQPEGANLIYFQAKRYGNTFKLTHMEKPN